MLRARHSLLTFPVSLALMFSLYLVIADHSFLGR